MELRNHPMMFCDGQRNWPPTWTWIGGKEKEKKMRGEIGVLLDIIRPTVSKTHNLFHLIIEHESATYIGTLKFDNASFCHQIYMLLLGYCRRSIQQIGGIDVSHLS